MSFYSRFQQNPNYRLNLEDMVSSSIKEREGFHQSGYAKYGSPSEQFVNFLTMAFYDSHAFDLGKSPHYVNTSQIDQRSYEADMWWSIAYTAYNSVQNVYGDIEEQAKAIYDAYVHNYIYWTVKNGQQPQSNAFPMTDIQNFENLPSYIAIRFIFLAYLAKMLYHTILSSMTTEQIRFYADACMAQSTISLPVYGFSTSDL